MQKLFELPKRGLSGFLRRATPAEAAAVLHQTLDEGLLKQLGPFAAVHPYALEGKVKELHLLVVSPKPAPGGAESSGQVSMPSACYFGMSCTASVALYLLPDQKQVFPSHATYRSAQCFLRTGTATPGTLGGTDCGCAVQFC